MERAAGSVTKNRIIGLLAVALLLVLLVGGGFALFVRSSPVANTAGPYATLPVPSPITASSNGYTVTLYPVSADPSRVFITYTVAAPPGHNANATYFAGGVTEYWELEGPLLRTSDGTSEFPARSLKAS